MKIAATALRGVLLALATVLLTAASAQAATVTEFWEGITLPAGPAEIAAGPDGNLWFTETDGDAIGRITPSGVVTEFLEGISENSGPLGITAGPDGNLWFTEYDAGRIGRITPAGVVTEFSAGITPGSSPRSIVTGADGNLWYTDTNGRRIGRITPAGVVTEFSIDGTGPGAIAAGPDGNVWWTEMGAIGRITPAGDFTRFTGPYGFLMGMATGPDGNLWVTESFGPIRRVNTAGTITGTFTLPAEISPFGITAGPDGNLWFTDSGYDSIGRITPAGAIAIVSTGVSLDSDPRDITAGPDGNLWFTEQAADQIGRVTPSIAAPVVGAGDATAVTTTTATLNGSVNPDGVETLARFEYGTTTAYGSQTAVQFVADTVAEPVVAALTNLQPNTTYHYRLVAAGGGGSATSADRTFTTAAVTQPPPPPPPPAAACSNGVDDDRDGFADSADPRCHADGDPRNRASYRPQGATEAPADDPVRVCRSGGLALVSAERTSQGRRIRLRGVADPAQAGQRVGLYAGGRRLGSARVRANGSFAGSLAAPRRGGSGLRYQARLGTRRSQSLAVQRRLAGVRLSLSGGRVVLSGRIVGRRPRSVELLGREGCGSFKPLATARVSGSGRFSLSAAAFGAVDIATFRVRIAAAGAVGARESTPPAAIALR